MRKLSIATPRLPAGSPVVLWLLVTAVVAALPYLGADDLWTRRVLLAATTALLVSGLNLNLGWAGELNMGLPALYGAGAYVTAYVATNVYNDLIVSLALSAVAAVVIGLLAGIPGLRLGGWMLAVCTFLLVGLIPVTLHVIPTSVLGGQSGFAGIPVPEVFGRMLTIHGFYTAAIVVTSLWFAVYRNALMSPFGKALLVLQHGPVLGPSLGISGYRLKLATYAFASIPVGMAGTLFAYRDQFVSPDSFGVGLIMTLLVASIVAGRRSIYAIFVGVVFVQYVDSLSTSFGEYGDIAFGGFLLLGGLVFGGGVAGILRRAGLVAATRPRSDVPAAPEAETPSLPGVDLRLEELTKVFGGVRAVDAVTLTARAGQITALIGPNGSGKTTTLNLVNGFQRPTSGRVVLGDRAITGQSAMRIARAGVARTFQTPAIPAELTVLDVVGSGLMQGRRPSLLSSILRLPGYRRLVAENQRVAMRWLHLLGLAGVADEPAASMALGTRRMIELARALASDPAVLLLDEVASGLDGDEVQELAGVLRRMRAAGATIVLVEHNFSLVRMLADHVVVLADGSVVAEGEPDEIAQHPEVLERFLGSGAGVSGTTLHADLTAGGEVE